MVVILRLGLICGIELFFVCVGGLSFILTFPVFSLNALWVHALRFVCVCVCGSRDKRGKGARGSGGLVGVVCVWGGVFLCSRERGNFTAGLLLRQSG